MNKELKNHLAIEQWLELLKEDKNLCGAYISLSQYINIVEKENTNLKQALNEIREYVNGKRFFIRMDEPSISVNEITKYELVKNDILQIIDKVLGDKNE